MKGTIAKIFLFTLLALSVAWPHAARAEDPTRDIDQSTRLTDYLQSHQLPLVGAQVLRFSNQGEVVMLYGYSASELGKNYAEERTRLFLQDPEIPITNRIKIRSELASMESSSTYEKSDVLQEEDSEVVQRMDSDDVVQEHESDAAQSLYIGQQVQQYLNNSPSGVKEQKFPLLGLLRVIGLRAPAERPISW